jgi:hypothetical protein
MQIDGTDIETQEAFAPGALREFARSDIELFGPARGIMRLAFARFDAVFTLKPTQTIFNHVKPNNAHIRIRMHGLRAQF